VALRHLVARDLTVLRADVLLLEPLATSLVDEMKVDLVRRLARRVDLHGYRDEAERDRRRVDGARGHVRKSCERRTTTSAHAGRTRTSSRCGTRLAPPSRMQKVSTWRVILGSLIITTGIVASYSFRPGVQVADAAPRGGADAGVGSAGAARGDAGTHPGGGVRGDGGVGGAGG